MKDNTLRLKRKPIQSEQVSESKTSSILTPTKPIFISQSDSARKLDLPQDQVDIINQFQKFYKRPNSPEPLTFYSFDPK